MFRARAAKSRAPSCPSRRAPRLFQAHSLAELTGEVTPQYELAPIAFLRPGKPTSRTDPGGRQPIPRPAASPRTVGDDSIVSRSELPRNPLAGITNTNPTSAAT